MTKHKKWVKYVVERPWLDTEKDTLDKSNIEAQKKGQFKPGNKYRYTKQPDTNQSSIDEIESEIEEPPIEG